MLLLTYAKIYFKSTLFFIKKQFDII